MLVFPASAEPNPNASAAQAESKPATTPASPKTAPAEAKSQAASPNAAAGETKPANSGAEAEPEDSKAATGKTKPEGDTSAATAPEKPKSSVLINIDKSSQEMTVFVDGVELYSWPVSTGRRGYSTPSGTYTTTSMNKIWYSKQWDNAPMFHAIFFTKKGHAIHGTLEEKNLGKAASHGCVRISRKNAETLFALVEQNGLDNTQVVLAGTTPGGEGPAVASQGGQPEAYPPPWFGPGEGYYQQQQPPQRRRGLFGRRWFQPFGGPQGYYAPRGNYYYRGVGPRGY
jgi:lipoprotein-anchoring transpeptidase ErfK/SrfK